jgi:SAM-dependent methyltransferase/predicted  nucleic acid-binding Zn-ribbon protein
VVALDLAELPAGADARIRSQAERLPFPDETFDVVVFFEALEHVPEPTCVLDEIVRVLRGPKILLLSTPDRRIYTERAGHQNPHHCREFERRELLELLRPRFRTVRLYGQSLWAGSWLAPLDRRGSAPDAGVREVEAIPDPMAAGSERKTPAPWAHPDELVFPTPVYLFAACARTADGRRRLETSLPTETVLHDPGQWLVGRYLSGVREAAELQRELDLARLGATDLEVQLKRARVAQDDLTSSLGEARKVVKAVKAELRRGRARHRDLDTQLARARAGHEDLEAQLAGARTSQADLESQLGEARSHHADLEAQLTGARTSQADLEAELGEARSRHEDLEAQLTGARTSQADLESQLGEARSHHEDLEAQLGSARRNANDLYEQMQLARKTQRALETEVSRLERRSVEHTSQIESLSRLVRPRVVRLAIAASQRWRRLRRRNGAPSE